MIVDTHSHIQLADYDHNRDEVLARARVADVAMVAVGVDVPSSVAAVELAKLHEDVFATVGLHPHDAAHETGELAAEDVAAIAALAEQPEVVAIGECGLDYYYDNSPRDIQQDIFKQQIELALRLDKPMVWHVRDAFVDFFEVVDQYPGVCGIVHCFTGTQAEMQAAVDRGFYIAYNGIMTFTKDQDQLETVKATPLNRIVLETDCPWLAPKAHRGRPNEPSYITEIAQFIADLRGEAHDQFCVATTMNAKTILGIPS
jgi:TatD DNase family protein